MWIFAGRLTSYVLIFACLCLTIEIYLTPSAFHVFNRRFTQIRADSIIALADLAKAKLHALRANS